MSILDHAQVPERPPVVIDADLVDYLHRCLIERRQESQHARARCLASGYDILVAQHRDDINEADRRQRELLSAITRSGERGGAALLDGVGRVYSHVTGGTVTDPHASPAMVIRFAKDRSDALCREARAKWRACRAVGRERAVVADLMPAADWRASAACKGADPDLFMPSPGESLEPALEFCRTCPVKGACLEAALSGREVGIWGATSGRERERMLSRRRLEHIGSVA